MFCTRCGEKGFPVGLACSACGSQLPRLPRVIDPDAPADVRCSDCGRVACDAIVFCLHCRARFPRPFTFACFDEKLAANLDIETFVISSAGAEACEACRLADGRQIPRDGIGRALPVPDCARLVCNCAIAGIFPDEGAVILY